VTGLWRGVTPTAQRAAIVAAVQLPAYDFAKEMLVAKRILTESWVCHLTASIVAATSAAVASNPVDVIRTRMMIQRKYKKKDGHKIYRNSLECVTHVVKKEGVISLYKGFVPAFFRMGPWNVVFFLVYENLKFLNT